MIYSESAAAIVEAMQATGLRRVVVTSTALLFSPTKILDRVVRLIARNNFQAAGLMEQRIRRADLEWIFARTGFLTDKADNRYTKAVGAMPDGAASISRLALASFLVTELKQPKHVGDVVGLCGVKDA